MPRRGRSRGQFVAAALVGGLLAACTAGPSARPPVVENDGPPPSASPGNAEPAPLPGLDEPRGSAIGWSDCRDATAARLDGDLPEKVRQHFDTTAPAGTGVRCSHITSKLDTPGTPRRGLARLALLRIGDGPVPLVVVNDVNGLPGTLRAVELAATLPSEMLETFSLIGMDRRGTGESGSVDCVPPETRATLLGHDPTTTVDPLLDAARVAGQQCAISLEDSRTALDSWRTAGDLDELRDQLGVPRLNLLGRGEGSTSVAHYAARYPDRVGRVVLDGMPDPSSELVTVLDGVAGSAEAALDEFAADCSRRDCPLGDDARTAVEGLIDRARATPLRSGDQPTLGPALVAHAVLTGLADPARWPELADAVAAGSQGDGAALAAFVRPLLTDTGSAPPRLDITLATRCNDTTVRLPADRIRQVSRDFGAEHPVFGGVVAQRLAWCSPWPNSNATEPEFGSPDAPPMVVVSTAVDPVTPEEGTIRAAERLPTAVRVEWQGTGHGALGSACVADAVSEFLVDGAVPRDGTLCPA